MPIAEVFVWQVSWKKKLHEPVAKSASWMLKLTAPSVWSSLSLYLYLVWECEGLKEDNSPHPSSSWCLLNEWMNESSVGLHAWVKSSSSKYTKERKIFPSNLCTYPSLIWIPSVRLPCFPLFIWDWGRCRVIRKSCRRAFDSHQGICWCFIAWTFWTIRFRLNYLGLKSITRMKKGSPNLLNNRSSKLTRIWL